MTKSVPLVEGLKAIRRHPGLLAKGLYITVLARLIVGTLNQIFSAENWVAIGSGQDALLIAWVGGLVAAAIAIGKTFLKDSLSDDGRITQIGIYRENTDGGITDEPWKFTTTRIIILCAAALVFVVIKLSSVDALTSILGHSTRSVIRKNALAACQIANDLDSAKVSDRAKALTKISEVRQNLSNIAPSIDSEPGLSDDKLVLYGSLAILDASESEIKYRPDLKEATAEKPPEQFTSACQTLDHYR